MRFTTHPPGKLQELIDAKRPIYVLNTSSLPSGDKGTIIINFYDGKRKEFFKMPPTFIPMAISHVISAKKLEDSRDFKEALQAGMLTLVDSDQAYEYLETKTAREEFDNLVLSEHSMKSKSLNIDQNLANRAQVSHSSNEMTGPQQDVSHTDTVSNKVRGLMESMISKTIDAKECLITLRRHQTALNVTDLSYVIQNSTDNQLTVWAKTALNAVTANGGVKQSLVEQPLVNTRPTNINTPGSAKIETFDFSSDNGDMTNEEARMDAEAKSTAHSSQALNGESKVTNEIDKILGKN